MKTRANQHISECIVFVCCPMRCANFQQIMAKNIGNTKKKKTGKGKGTAIIGYRREKRNNKKKKNQQKAERTADHGPKLGSANTLCLDSACH